MNFQKIKQLVFREIRHVVEAQKNNPVSISSENIINNMQLILFCESSKYLSIKNGLNKRIFLPVDISFIKPRQLGLNNYVNVKQIHGLHVIPNWISNL